MFLFLCDEAISLRRFYVCVVRLCFLNRIHTRVSVFKTPRCSRRVTARSVVLQVESTPTSRTLMSPSHRKCRQRGPEVKQSRLWRTEQRTNIRHTTHLSATSSTVLRNTLMCVFVSISCQSDAPPTDFSLRRNSSSFCRQVNNRNVVTDYRSGRINISKQDPTDLTALSCNNIFCL